MYLETTGGSIKFNILNAVLLDRDLPDNIKDFVIKNAATLTDRLNELLDGDIAYGYEIEAYFEEVGDHDFEINIVF